MTEMRGDIVNRVRRLPKPSTAAEALQPVFEAVSNAIQAIEDRYGDQAIEKGRVDITISNIKMPSSIDIVITDNGIGINDDRFAAFCTADTDFKLQKGGKGIGRLLWLDAFEKTDVVSTYQTNGDLKQRSFRFQLAPTDQITDAKVAPAKEGAQLGTSVHFVGLRGNAYSTKFPSQARHLIRRFGSHFLADFILGRSPRINLSIDSEGAAFPSDVRDLLEDDRGTATICTDEFGELELASFVCKRAASAEFDGLHQLHYIANGRTVTTRKIDGLLGIGRFGANDDLVYHGCVSGEYLNERVNQERTHFNFDETVSEEIAKTCTDSIRNGALRAEIIGFDEDRLETMKTFLDEYPSFRFESPEDLLTKTPKNAVKPEQFAQALIITRIRRDMERRKDVQEIVNLLAGTGDVPDDFAGAVRRAADEVRAEEQRQLTEYVLRRKMVLDVLEVLIRRVREAVGGRDDYHLESTLHQFICPMKIRGDDPRRVESADHDLWVIDERLAFAKYFASDVPTSEIVNESRSEERPDVFLFDRLHGLGLEEDEPLTRALLIEFKKPGRKDYDERYSPMNQISRYLTNLAGGHVEKFNGDRIRVASDCIFYCFVVADIIGNLDVHTSTWRTTANGRGRWVELSGKFRGSIEIIEWKDLIRDARTRNHAFIHAAGM